MRTDRHDEANSRLFATLRTRLKTTLLVKTKVSKSTICYKFRNPNAPGSFGYALSWQRATPEDYNCMVLKSNQQLQQGQIQKCEMDEEVASLWNELLPRLKWLSVADIKGDTGIRNTDSRLGQGKRQTSQVKCKVRRITGPEGG